MYRFLLETFLDGKLEGFVVETFFVVDAFSATDRWWSRWDRTSINVHGNFEGGW